MKPAHDPNRQQPTAPVRPPGPNVIRTTSATPTTSLPTNVTSHIVSTGNPAITSIKTIPVSAARVVPHATATTLTLVGSATAGASLRPVSPATGITTSFHVAKGPATIAGPRGAVASPMMRNIVTAPIITSPAASSTPTSFVSGIRALARPALTSATASGSSPWPATVVAKGTATAPTKITPAVPSFTPGTPIPRSATTSLTVTTRPVVAAPTVVTPARPEIATLRTTKPVSTPDKFIRTPARTTLAFATTAPGQSSGQFTSQSSTPLTHLTVAPMPANQPTSGTGTALTLQPIVVSTTTSSSGGPAKMPSATPGRGLHPIGPKVITQPAHGHIITHLAGVGGKPGAQVAGTVRGPAPQAAGGATFATTPGGAQVKVLAQAPLLTDVLTQQGGTTTIIPGSVFIQATQHTAVNVTPLDRGTVATSASYTLPAGYFYDATAGGGSLIATSTTHAGMGHAAPPHQIIRNFTPSIGQGTVATMQVQTAGSFQQTDDTTRKTFPSNLTAHAVGSSLVSARFNQVMVMDTGRSPLTSATTSTTTAITSQPEAPSEQPGAQQSQLPSVPISLSSQTPQPSQQQQQPVSQPSSISSQPILTSAFNAQSVPSQQPQQTSSDLSSQQAGSSFLSGTTTPTSTPSKLCASPRPSILRKRDHDGTPSKVQKNLGPMLAALTGSLPSSGNSSPPPSPPMRPDSQEDARKDGNGGHSSAGSSTISATSSPGLPCDGDNNGGSQSNLSIKAEPADTADGASNNGTNGNSDIMSPRKKPRKQQLTGNELQEPPYSDENAEFAEDKVKSEVNHKASQEMSAQGASSRGTPATRRPSVSLLQAYRSCWKPRNNHFIRPTDVRPREERRPTVAELSSQKRVVQKARGWKLHHLSTQMENMGEREADVLDQLSQVLNEMETPRPGFEPNSKDMNRTHELIRSNMQRSKVVRDQLEECRIQLIRLLDHTSPVVDIIKRNANRRQAKKKY